jgi:hypothetical protein
MFVRRGKGYVREFMGNGFIRMILKKTRMEAKQHFYMALHGERGILPKK